MTAKFFRIGLVLVAVVALGLFVAPKKAEAAARASVATNNWNSTSTWSTACGGVSGSSVPGATDTVTICNGTNVTLNANSASLGSLTIASGGTLTATGTNTLTATTITVNGTYIHSSTGTITGAMTVNNGGTFQHNVNNETVPSATWNAGSLLNVTGVTSTALSGLNQAFSDITWNSTSQTVTDMRFNEMTAIRNLTITSTGTGSIRLASNNSGSIAETVSGNYVQTGGTFNLSNGTGGEVGTLNVTGDFSQTGGTITETATGTGSGLIVFNKSGTQTYTSGGTVSNTINFTVNSGSTLQMAAASTTVTGGGSFTLSSGATLGIRSADGITTSGATGNIQVTGTRTYTTGANYIYNGSINQAVGNGLTQNTPANLTIANTGGSVTLSTAATVTGVLTLTSDLTASATLTQSGTCGGDGVTTGAGDVVGTVSRSDQGASAKCFGNSLNQITFSSGVPSGSVTVRLTKSAPGGFNGSVVQRYYTISSNSWSGASATLQLRYKTGELSGITENTLVLYKYPTGGTKYIEQGGTVNTSSHFVNLTGVSSFSDWTFAASGTPTAVGLNTFRAKLTPKDKVKAKWSTGSELNILEFNLYRQTAGSKKWVKVNTAPIPATNPGKVFGADYTFTDKNVQAGTAYRYKLEVVGTTEPSQWSDIVKITVP